MSKSESSSGLDFLDLLSILFIALKLLGVIHWSWFWVLAPIWIQLVIILVVFILLGIVSFIIKE